MATAATERIAALLDPVVAGDGYELVDVEVAGSILRVYLDRPGGVGLDALGGVSRMISEALDEAEDALGELARRRWVLEVSSPGVERRLRTPEQFARFVGEEVSVKTVPGTEGPRRIEGTLTRADADGVTVGDRDLTYGEVARARTRFVWPPPSSSSRGPDQRKAAARR